MAERKINGTFSAVPGGYSRELSGETTLFVPSFCASRFNSETGELFGYAPDYDALEAAKTPAVQATAPGVYSYCYELERAPIGCDFSATLSYYGKHYFLTPLSCNLPRLRGRGITFDEQQGDYMVTRKAFEKLKTQYRITMEHCLD